MKNEILKKLSESNLRWSIKSNVENEIIVSLNNFHQETFSNLEEAVNYLKDLALEHYPDSEFANWWNEQCENKRVMYGN